MENNKQTIEEENIKSKYGSYDQQTEKLKRIQETIIVQLIELINLISEDDSGRRRRRGLYD